MSKNELDEPIGHVLKTGTWWGALGRIPRPVVAIGAKQLYRVMIHGSGFSLPPLADAPPIVGFVTTRFVAAANVRDAEAMARSSVLTEWKRRGYEALAGGSPTLGIEHLELVYSRFRVRSGAGFTFFAASEED